MINRRSIDLPIHMLESLTICNLVGNVGSDVITNKGDGGDDVGALGDEAHALVSCLYLVELPVKPQRSLRVELV